MPPAGKASDAGPGARARAGRNLGDDLTGGVPKLLTMLEAKASGFSFAARREAVVPSVSSRTGDVSHDFFNVSVGAGSESAAVAIHARSGRCAE